MSSPTETRGITLDELLALPDDGYRYEVSRGRLIREPPPGDRHGEITVQIAVILSDYLKTQPIGRLRSGSGFRLAHEPMTVRGPDVAFVRQERLRALHADPYFEGAPDLAIEVVSPSNTASDLQEKVAEYFEAATQIVWVVYPRTRSVAVYHPNGEVRILSDQETLSAPSLLPGFEVKVAHFFD